MLRAEHPTGAKKNYQKHGEKTANQPKSGILKSGPA